tara:strand:- start:1345 stop:2061 length:717 start_codon:yes stop_codon:yes gene_type:complete
MLVTQEFTVEVEGNTILDDLTLEYGPGVHIVMGPNGVGKSTFAHALMGKPDYITEGAVQINGKDLLAMEVHERAQAGLFVSFQTPTPIEGLSNYQFMRQCLKEKDVTIKESLGEFKRIASEYGLPDQWDKKHLNVQASGGEKKKNELIQLELLNPTVAILDEPDSGLDVDAINTLVRRLTNYVETDDSRCLIIISHYQQLIEKLNPQTVTVFRKNGTAIQTDDISITQKILESGFNAV